MLRERIALRVGVRVRRRCAALAATRIVPDHQLVAANNLGASSEPRAVAGPALAGVLIGVVGVTTCFAVDTATFAGSIVAVVLLPPLRPLGEAQPPSLRALADGFRFIRSRPVILGFLLVDTNAMIFGMPTSLFPALATHRFHDASLVGYLYASTYAGALVASLLGGWANHVRRQGLVVAVAAALWGAAIAAFGFATQPLARAAPARGRGRRRPGQRRAAQHDAARADAGLPARPGRPGSSSRRSRVRRRWGTSRPAGSPRSRACARRSSRAASPASPAASCSRSRSRH